MRPSEIKGGQFPAEDVLQFLLTSAITNEETISASATALRATAELLEQQARSLPDRLAAEVDRKLQAAADVAALQISSRLTDANSAAERAQQSYERAANFSIRNIALVALACFVCGCIGMVLAIVITAWRILPDPATIQRALEAEHTVATLAPRGGNSALSKCQTDQGLRLCIRTDERDQSGPWGGPGETYRLVYGY